MIICKKFILDYNTTQRDREEASRKAHNLETAVRIGLPQQQIDFKYIRTRGKFVHIGQLPFWLRV